MISIAFVLVVLAGFLVCASMGVMYLKPACPKCKSRAAISYKAAKGRSKKAMSVQRSTSPLLPKHWESRKRR